MDEEKAAAYYDEMRRKGGGAAKLKQGLGYGASSSPPPPSYGSFPSFVKGGVHSESLVKHEKESRLASVRDKLKKRPVDDDAADRHGDRHYPRSQEKMSKREQGHGHGHFANGRSRSRSQDREHTVRRERRKTHTRRRSHSSSSSSRDRRSRSRSFSSDSSYRKSGRHSHDRNIGKREKRPRESLPRARRTSKSPRQSSRRSLSPKAHGSDNPGHSHRDSRKSLKLSRRSRSPHAERHRKREPRKEQTHSSRKANECDYSKLIPGYDDMTPAEKVKQKMKLQLSETVSKDTARGMDSEWERFAFNKNAPLDDDAKLDYFGDGTGAQDDTVFLQNTGSTFLSTCSQAKREAQVQAAHEAAIFGPFTDLSSKRVGAHGKESHHSLTNEITTDDDDDTVVQVEAPPPVDSLLSDQVLTFQQGSWRERALKLKQQRPTSTIT